MLPWRLGVQCPAPTQAVLIAQLYRQDRTLWPGAHSTGEESRHRHDGRGPACRPAAYLAFAMHSKVISPDPATTLLLPGGITMTGAMVLGAPTSPVADKAQSAEGVRAGDDGGSLWGCSGTPGISRPTASHLYEETSSGAHPWPLPALRACGGIHSP